MARRDVEKVAIGDAGYILTYADDVTGELEAIQSQPGSSKELAIIIERKDNPALSVNVAHGQRANLSAFGMFWHLTDRLQRNCSIRVRFTPND